MATTKVRWKRLKPRTQVAAERQRHRERGLDPDAVSATYPLMYTRHVTPEDQGTSQPYAFSRANGHTVEMPDRDAQVLLHGDDGEEFEEIPD